MALRATAYERPVAPCVLGEQRRACDLWNECDKALAHIYLARAGPPPCGEVQALRLFVADELIEAGVTPAALMQAQGSDPAPFDFLKANFNPAEPRWPAGSGHDSFRPCRERRGHRGASGGIDAIRSFLEWWLKRKEGAEPQVKPFGLT